MAQVRGFDLKTSARYALLPFLSMTACCLAGGVLSDRLTRIHGLRIGSCGLAAVALLSTAVFLVFGSQVHSPQLAGVILAGGAGSLYLSQSSFWSVSVDIAGRSSSVFSSMVNMGGQIGGPSRHPSRRGLHNVLAGQPPSPWRQCLHSWGPFAG